MIILNWILTILKTIFVLALIVLIIRAMSWALDDEEPKGFLIDWEKLEGPKISKKRNIFTRREK